MNTTRKNGFTLIELIMVMIILGIMAAAAIPRYLETIEKSEVASEDAVVNNIMVALENYAQNKMLTEGRRYWPDNPFDALEQSHRHTLLMAPLVMTIMNGRMWLMQVMGNLLDISRIKERITQDISGATTRVLILAQIMMLLELYMSAQH